MKKTQISILLLTGVFLVSCGPKSQDTSQSSITSSSVTPEVLLDHIAIENTTKVTYDFNEEFVAPVVTAFYSDNSQKDVSKSATSTGYNKEKSGQQTINVSYVEKNIKKDTQYNVTVGNAPRALKFAIFADVQLCNDIQINASETEIGAATNLGATANAPSALKSHFEFCKKNNINTIVMNGDITNQANPHYYDYYQSILESVYGKETEENPYPEFIMNMGNHEWWNGISENEGTAVNAIGLFNEHANIDSEYLVAKSSTKYSVYPTENLPSYYKVINGIPFLVISGINSTGQISDELYNELDTWLNEIKQLDSVKNGGPIFVEYHYALTTSMTHGQGSGKGAASVEQLLEDTPNAVVFTGDTHFPGTNERAINQFNFTTINLGSSSYSRMVDESALVCSDFYNVTGSSSSSKADKMVGNIKYKEAYTPTIQVVDVYKNNKFTVDRYFTKENGEAKKVGQTWTFDPIVSTSDFKYTSDRFDNKNASKSLYGAEGLSWGNSDEVTFGYNEKTSQMTVRFPDVNEYHYCEHYLIEVNGKEFDVVSNYYKYLEERENNYYILDVIKASTYDVKVTAYDFFDNPSLNTLTSSTNNVKMCIDSIDAQSATTYSDIQVRNNVTDVAPNSNSSIEYYYKGKYEYKYGAILSVLLKRSGTAKDDCRDFVSIKDTGTNVAPIVKFKVKNLSSSNLIVGLTVVDKDGKWLTDFGKEQQVKITSKDWTEVSWNLYDEFKFTSFLDANQITLKAKLEDSTSEGYSMNFLYDDLDVIGEEIEIPEKGNLFSPQKDFGYDLKTAIPVATGSITFDLKFTSDSTTKAAIMFGDGWSDYLGYVFIYPTTKVGDIKGLTSVTTLADGYTRYVFKLSDVIVGQGTPVNINLFYIRDYAKDGWTTATGYALVIE